MNALNVILLILALLMGIFLVVAVVLQKAKGRGLSGAIAGGADTFFGKEQGPKVEKWMDRLTKIVGIAFVVLVVIVYVIQPDYASSTYASTDSWKGWSEFAKIFEEVSESTK